MRPRLSRRPLVGLPGLGLSRELLPRSIVCDGSLARAIACTIGQKFTPPPRPNDDPDLYDPRALRFGWTSAAHAEQGRIPDGNQLSLPCMRACVVVPLLSSSEPFALPPSLLPSPLEPLPAQLQGRRSRCSQQY